MNEDHQIELNNGYIFILTAGLWNPGSWVLGFG
jgi:hypothetical protein